MQLLALNEYTKSTDADWYLCEKLSAVRWELKTAFISIVGKNRIEKVSSFI
jgi:hypothetical protein